MSGEFTPQTTPPDTVPPGAPLPANLTLPGGVGCSAIAPFQPAASPGQTVLTVGAAGEYHTIAAAIAAAANGDLILVAPGTYTNDFADITKQVTIAGAGGLVTMQATEAPTNDKGFFVVDASVQIDNFVFEGAAISASDGGNGAGIRYQGGAMVLHNDAFIGNQDGILAAAVDNLPVNTVSIQRCTFDDNGNTSGPDAGYTHNCYISTGVATLTATGNIFERANIGHELKSRAATNIITGNVFYDGPAGTASYAIDLPDGGADTISGNIIEKGPDAQNGAIIHFGGEGIPYAGSTLTITGNHFINDLGSGAIGLLNQTTLGASITGNEFDYFGNASIAQGVFTASGNVDEHGNAIAASSSGNFAPGTDLDDFSQDTLPHTVTLTTQTGVLGGGGLLTVSAQAGHVTVIGGAGGLNYQEASGWGGSSIATAAGATDTIAAAGQDIIQSNGTDTITLGAGNITAQINGTAQVSAGTGNSGFAINGAASIAGGGGSDTVQVNAAAAIASITGSLAYLQASDNGGLLAFSVTQGGGLEQATISGGASAAQIYGATTNVTTSGAGAGSAITLGAGAATIFSEGADTIRAGTGADTVIVSASSKITASQTGTLAVFGRAETGQASVYGAGGTVTLGGDTGDITYIGGAKANTVNSLLSHCTLQGGTGLLSITGGGSGEYVTGGAGGIVFSTPAGADTITTEAGACDSLNFAGGCVVTSNGHDLINAGSGNSTITANGSATINGSTGNGLYTLHGHDSLNALGASRVTVCAGAAAAITTHANSTYVSIAGGGALTLSQSNTAGAAQTLVSAAGSGAEFWSSGTNAGTLDLYGDGSRAALGAGQMTVSLCGTGQSVQAGAGQDSVTISHGGNIVQAGSGAMSVAFNDWSDQSVTTIDGGSGALAINAGYGAMLFIGGTGAATIGGESTETVLAGAGNITLQGGSSGTNFTAGSGSASVTLTPGGGTITLGTHATAVTEAAFGKPDIYVFNSGSGGGSDTITGFRNGTDSLVFNGVSIAGTVSSGGATQLRLSDGTQITLAGVASLTVHP